MTINSQEIFQRPNSNDESYYTGGIALEEIELR